MRICHPNKTPVHLPSGRPGNTSDSLTGFYEGVPESTTIHRPWKDLRTKG